MTLKTDNYQIGLDSVTDTNNFLIQTNGVCNLHIHRGVDSAGPVVLRIKPDNTVEFPTSPGILTKLFTSTEQNITAASLLTLPHGFGVTPLLYSITLKCVTADLGYSVNDLVPVNVSGDLGTTSSQWGVYHDTTNINIRIGNAATVLTNKGTGVTGTAVNANWRMIVRAWA